MRLQRHESLCILCYQRSLWLRWRCTNNLCCHFLFALVVDVVTELAGEGVLSELLHADDSILMSSTIDELRNMSKKWKEAFKSNSLKANLGKTMVMVSEGVAKHGLSKS